METKDKIAVALQFTQIVFYLVGTAVAVLTYRAARRVLLNSINTEYRKKVIDRLLDLAKELAAEFIDDSDERYWVKSEPMKEIIDDVIDDYPSDGSTKSWHPPQRVTTIETRLHRQLSAVVADPLLPTPIRQEVLDFLQMRIGEIRDANEHCLNHYVARLKSKKMQPNVGDEPWLHNVYMKHLNERGWGIVETEKRVDNLRLRIQEYFESFDPLRKKPSGKPVDMPSRFFSDRRSPELSSHQIGIAYRLYQVKIAFLQRAGEGLKRLLR